MSVWLGIAAVSAVAALVLYLRRSWVRFQEDWDQVLPEARQLYPVVPSEADKYQDRLERRDAGPDFQVYDPSAVSGVPDIANGAMIVGERVWMVEESRWAEPGEGVVETTRYTDSERRFTGAGAESVGLGSIQKPRAQEPQL